jgi:glucosamine-phosphate N-acetyltransferase
MSTDVRGGAIIFRPLEAEDYHRGYMKLLAQLTAVGDVTEAKFRARLLEMQQSKMLHTIVGVRVPVAPATEEVVVATTTVLLEPKFARGCGSVAHIEDVVVDSECRGQRLGARIVEAALDVARKAGCYKAILDSSPENAPFYEKLGFHRRELQLRLDLAEPSRE